MTSWSDNKTAIKGEIIKFVEEKGMEDIVIVGFSNGSNIAINTILKDSSRIKKVILMAPLYPVNI